MPLHVGWGHTSPAFFGQELGWLPVFETNTQLVKGNLHFFRAFKNRGHTACARRCFGV